MKRSVKVSAPLVAAAALSVLTTGCRKPEMQRCVDEKNQVVADSFCANAPKLQQNGPGYGSPGYVPIYIPYHYYYGGGGGYGLGSSVYGGSTTMMSGRSYATSSGRVSSTSRGGFGSSFGGGSSSGGGGGESGGS